MRKWSEKNRKYIKGQAKRWISFLMVVVLVFSTCNISAVDAWAEPAEGEDAALIDTAADTDLVFEEEGEPEAELAAQTPEFEMEDEEELAVEGVELAEMELTSIPGTSISYFFSNYKLQIYKTGDSGSMPDWDEPSSENCPWFGNSRVHEVVIKKDITHIGKNAFASLPNLNTVQFEANGAVVTVGEGAFKNCPNLGTVDFENTNIAVLGARAFMNCSTLEKITFPEQYSTSIGEYVFAGCTALAEMTVMNKDTTFPAKDKLFGVGTGNIAGPEAVMIRCKDSSNAYKFCENNAVATSMVMLKSFSNSEISKDEETPSVKAELYKLAGEYILAISGAGEMKDFSTAEKAPWITWIEDSANQSSIDKVIVTGNVTSIGSYAFADCSSLKTVDLTESKVASIGHDAFSGCSGLTDVLLQKGGQIEIGEAAFAGCSSMTEFVVPKETVATFETRAFEDCTNLERVHAPNKRTDFAEEKVFWDTATQKNRDTYIRCMKGGLAHNFCLENRYAITELVDENGELITDITTYKVTFEDSNGDTPLTIENVEEGTVLSEEYAPHVEKAGYDFLGWFLESADENNGTPIKGYKVKSDVTFRAKYKRIIVGDDISTGYEGDDVRFKLTDEGVLILSGTGKMMDFDKVADCPWYEQRNQIKAVEIRGGITHIGSNVCKELPNCTSISFQDNSEADKFDIGAYAFSDTAIESLVLPANTGNVAATAFWNTDSLKTVDIYGGTINGNPFEKRYKLASGITVSFYDIDKTTLVTLGKRPGKEGGAKLGTEDRQTPMSLVFHDGSALSKAEYIDRIEWNNIENVYAPDGTDYTQIPARSKGCNVTFEKVTGGTQITSIEKCGMTTILDLPERLLGEQIISAINAVNPGRVTIRHTGSSHKFDENDVSGKCNICGEAQYTLKEDTGRDGTTAAKAYIITSFNENVNYYILISNSGTASETYYQLAETDPSGELKQITIGRGKTLEVPHDCTLLIPQDVMLTIEEGASLVLNGTISVANGGGFRNLGKVSGTGKFSGAADASLSSVPAADNIWLKGEDDFNTETEVVIEPSREHLWRGAVFYIDYDYDAEKAAYCEKFEGENVREEIDPAKWQRVDKVEQPGIYRYVYTDPRNGEVLRKRFIVKKPKGYASITQADWDYGDELVKPVVSSTTNADAHHYLEYKKANVSSDPYKKIEPTLPGEYMVRVTFDETETNQAASAETTFTIHPRQLTIKMDDNDKVNYLDPEPTYTYQVNGGKGLAKGDKLTDKTIFHITPKCEADYSDGKHPDAGKYVIDAIATAENKRYDITVEPGELTINKIASEMTIATKTFRKTFGDDPFSLKVNPSDDSANIATTGDGSLVFEIVQEDPDVLPDEIKVSDSGMVTILNAGENEQASEDVRVRVTLMEGTNYLESEPQEFKIKVKPKVIDASISANALYYLCSDPNSVQISLADMVEKTLGKAPGAVDGSTFDRNRDITRIDSGTHKVFSLIEMQEKGVLALRIDPNKLESEWSFSVPVSMRNYKSSRADGIVRVDFRMYLLLKLNTKLADGEVVQIVNAEDGLVYGNQLSSLKLKPAKFVCRETGNVVQGKLEFVTPRAKPDAAEEYRADWIFTPNNKLYATCTGKTEPFKVHQAEPELYTLPTVGKVVYDEDQVMSQVAFVGGTASQPGEWSWLDPTEVPVCSKTEYTAVFTPANTNYKEMIRTIAVNVERAPLEFKTAPKTSVRLIYGSTLDKWPITGEVIYKSVKVPGKEITVDGEFRWVDGTKLPTFRDSEERVGFPVIFEPDDENYATLTGTATVLVSKAEFAPGYIESDNSSDFVIVTENKNKFVKLVPGPVADWVWDSAAGELAVPTKDMIEQGIVSGSVSVNAIYDGDDKGNYEHETMAYEISRENCVIARVISYVDPADMPTCTTGGTGQYLCELCDDVLETDVAVEPLGHDYGKPTFRWSVSENDITATTAEADFVCQREGCKDSEEGHACTKNCAVTCDVTEVGCESDGIDLYTAKVILTQRSYADAFASAPAVTTKTYTEQKKVIHPMLGHTLAPHYFAVEDGGEGDEGHPGQTCFIWTDNYNNCTVDFVCIRCDKTESVTEKTQCIATNTCLDKGTATYTATIKYLTYVLDAKKVVNVPAIGHRYYNSEYTKVATCTETGYWTKRCNFPGCKAYYYQNVPALGHTGGEASCSHAAVCERCGEEYGELAPQKHEETEVRNVKAHSCTADGYSGDVYCKACGKKIKTGAVIPEIGYHDWDNGVITKDATLLENGQRLHTCKLCGATKVQVFYYVPQEDEPLRTELQKDDKGKNYYELTPDPKNPKKIEAYYVGPASNDKKVTIPETITIDGREISVVGIRSAAFQGDKVVEKVTVGKNIKEIPTSCFENCPNLKSVSLGANVTVIGKQAFYNCKKLSSVKVGNKIVKIRSKAFAKCPKLKKIVLPKSVKTLGASVFANDKALRTLVIKSTKLTKKTLNKKAFAGIGTKVTVKVPKKKLKAYKKLFVKKGLAKNVKVKK